MQFHHTVKIHTWNASTDALARASVKSGTH